MGFLDYISDLYTCSSRRKSKRKPMQTVDIKVKMDCDGCERRVKNAVTNIKGVKTVDVNRNQSRVTVSGYVEAKEILKRIITRTGKRAELWPYVPYNLVAYPYVAEAYDKKAPSGFVKNVDYQTSLRPASPPTATATHETFITLFSDDNPNACAIM